MAFAAINGITLHYELIGDPDAKNLVVFSNSLGTDFRIWLPVFDELGDDVSVLLYDSRGHGLSGLGDKPFTMDDLVEDLIALVDFLDIKKAVFCGLSVGGMVVQGLWKKRPDLVRKVILCDTAPRIGTAEIWNGRIDAIRKGGLDGIGAGVMERWFTKDFHEERAEDLSGYRLMLERQSAEGYIGTCEAIRDTDFFRCPADHHGSDPLCGRRSGRLHPAGPRARRRRHDPRCPFRNHRGLWPYPLRRAARTAGCAY